MKISVLDHGYVELIEAWGVGKEGRDLRVESDYNHNYAVDDCDFEVGIIEAARQSTQGSFRGWNAAGCDCGVATTYGYGIMPCLETCATRTSPGDKRLLARLYNNNHSTPFEFAGMVIEVQAPIMVLREWHRHRTQSYNEASARYAPLPDLYYEPDVNHVKDRAAQAWTKESNKQAQSIAKPNWEAIEAWVIADHQLSRILEDHYQTGLAIGIPKELARKKMPVDHYSKMRATANLRNWLGFEDLRLPSNVMWEMRQYANAVSQIIEAKFPQTYALWQAKYASSQS